MNGYFIVSAGGDSISQIRPYLELIAEQNKLNLSIAREFKIARNIYERSIRYN